MNLICILFPKYLAFEFIYQKIEWKYLAGTSLTALDSTLQNNEFELYETEEEITTDFEDAYEHFEEEEQPMVIMQANEYAPYLNNNLKNEYSIFV